MSQFCYCRWWSLSLTPLTTTLKPPSKVVMNAQSAELTTGWSALIEVVKPSVQSQPSFRPLSPQGEFSDRQHAPQWTKWEMHQILCANKLRFTVIIVHYALSIATNWQRIMYDNTLFCAATARANGLAPRTGLFGQSFAPWWLSDCVHNTCFGKCEMTELIVLGICGNIVIESNIACRESNSLTGSSMSVSHIDPDWAG